MNFSTRQQQLELEMQRQAIVSLLILAALFAVTMWSLYHVIKAAIREGIRESALVRALWIWLALLAFSSSALAADLTYDPAIAARAATLRDLELRTRICIRDGAVAMLRMGQRDSDQIVAFAINTCAGPLVTQLTTVDGRPVAEAQAYAKALAFEALARVPDLQLSPQAKAVDPKMLIERGASIESASPFRCPDPLDPPARRRRAETEMLKRFRSESNVLSVESFRRFKIKLFADNRCYEALLDATKNWRWDSK
jgi:hypothetical protein